MVLLLGFGLVGGEFSVALHQSRHEGVEPFIESFYYAVYLGGYGLLKLLDLQG